jgi:hypothetical protein
MRLIKGLIGKTTNLYRNVNELPFLKLERMSDHCSLSMFKIVEKVTLSAGSLGRVDLSHAWFRNVTSDQNRRKTIEQQALLCSSRQNEGRIKVNPPNR